MKLQAALLLAILSLNLLAAPAQSAPAAEPPVIELPAFISPEAVDDDKLSEIIDAIRASREAAVNTVGRQLANGGTVVAATGIGVEVAGDLTALASSRKLPLSTLNPSRAAMILKSVGSKSFFAGVFLLGTGVFLHIYDSKRHQPSPRDSAMMIQSGGDLDTILKHDNSEIVAAAAKDPELKKRLIQIYQAILFINQPPQEHS